MPEEKEETKTEETKVDDTKKWDETQQKIDQAEAVAKKAQKAAETAKEEASLYAEELEGYKTEVERLKESVAQQQKTVDDEKNQLVAMDEITVDKSVINNISRLQTRLDQTDAELKEAQGKITQYETIEQTRAREAVKQQTIEKILTPLDEEFGAKYRNSAKKLADKLVDEDEEPKPRDALEAMVLMRKCYKQVVESEKGETSETPADDGGGSVPTPGKKKQGSIQEVLDDMRRDKSWKT